jgi:small-conductance mechanosensitive channel
MTFQEFIDYNFISVSGFHLSIFNAIVAIFIIIAARVLVRLISRVMKQYFNRRKIDAGRQYALSQFLKYIIYTVSFLIVMESFGISISVFWGAAAALMVGIGLGLQQTFNDLVSGLILLVEGSVEVDDIIEIDGLIGKVAAIGIRTSRVETRDRISILVPNSKLVGDKAINWSHNKEPSRFQVYTGVSYKSDTELVTLLLLQAATEIPEVLNTPKPEVHFKDFGNSSLDFVLHFFIDEYLRIDFIKSKLRYRIIQLFRENGVEIPFPQRDLWVRNALELKTDEIPENNI